MQHELMLQCYNVLKPLLPQSDPEESELCKCCVENADEMRAVGGVQDTAAGIQAAEPRSV